MKQTRLLTLLVLLMTAATGAWADETPLVTITFDSNGPVFSESGLVKLTGANYTLDHVTFGYYWVPSGDDLLSATIEKEEGSNLNITKVVYYSLNNNGYIQPLEDNDAPFVCYSSNNTKKRSLSSDNWYSGTATSPRLAKIDVYGTIVAPNYVALADDTEDAAKWTAKVGTGEFGKLPIGGLEGGETVTLKYSGDREVKSITATVVAPEPTEGKFSVSDTKKVNFAPGNLQATYNGITWTWAFAEHQWDYIGGDRWDDDNQEWYNNCPLTGNNHINGNGTLSENGTVDLFGWSTSTTYGINNSTNNSNYSGNFVEWGQLIDDDNTWRTLTIDEWKYLLGSSNATTSRPDASNLRTKATVNGVKGLIIMPDGWVANGVSLTPTVSVYTTNDIDATEWTTLASQGCVFLPAGGDRIDGISVLNASSRYYWTRSPQGSVEAYYICCSGKTNTSNITDSYLERSFGCSVRLVKDAK